MNKAIVTPVGRTSFLKVFKAEPNMNGTANVFSMKLLIPKDASMDWIQNVWDEVCLGEFDRKSPSGLRPLYAKGNPYDDKGAIMDGDWKYDSVDVDKRDAYAAYKGMWVIGLNAPESKPPMVVDEDKNEILNTNDLQSGDYVRCVVELSSYMSKKFKTPQVSLLLKVVQKDRAGERFGGGMSTDSALDLLSGDSSTSMSDL